MTDLRMCGQMNLRGHLLRLSKHKKLFLDNYVYFSHLLSPFSSFYINIAVFLCRSSMSGVAFWPVVKLHLQIKLLT